MVIRCPFCGARESQGKLGEVLRCRCGAWLFGPSLLRVVPPAVRARWEEGERARRLQRRADRICALILQEDYPAADIAIERAHLREECARLFPDRLDLYDMVYESRFERLWEQFRAPREGEP